MVAEHAGVSTALLRHHFGNRGRLFAEAMGRSACPTPSPRADPAFLALSRSMTPERDDGVEETLVTLVRVTSCRAVPS
jgi:AcrR family transcriptional regulator